MTDTMTAPHKEFRDPIHGFIPVYDEELQIIQDPVFQRLRRIKQLSFSYFVYHGAEHSRFGHVLGAMHVVDRALRKIQRNASRLDIRLPIQEADIRLARFAALLHDVGHKPFSHALDRSFPEQHEGYSAAFVMKRFSDTIDASHIDPQQVANLIQGKPDPEKPFLTSLISGQLDVDKFDYLLRDSHYAGVKYGLFDLDRLLDSLLVKDGRMVVIDGGFFAAEQLISARYHMFGQVYLHKTKRAFEGMATKVAEDLVSEDKLCYPAIAEFDDPATFDDFATYDDAWFLSKIKTADKPVLKNIARHIEGRIPYKEVSNSETIRRKMNTGGIENEEEGVGYHNAVESNVRANLSDIGIDPDEIIFDRSTSLPYKLRPYSNILGDQADEYADTVLVYDPKTDMAEPIEKKSRIVRAIARNFSIHRIFVTAEKRQNLEDYLRKNFEYFR